jgi:hypothetical protein
VLDAMQRRVDVDRVVQASELLRRRGIQVGMFIMLGYDGEEDVDLRATISHLKRSSPDIFLTTLSYPIKGTPYYAQVASRIRTDRPWTEGSDRDRVVAGRRPRRYYDFARRWIVGEVDRHRHWHDRRYVRSLRSASSAFIGRAGMKLVNVLDSGAPLQPGREPRSSSSIRGARRRRRSRCRCRCSPWVRCSKASSSTRLWTATSIRVRSTRSRRSPIARR